MSHALKAIQDWYESHCDGDWEHSSGINIQTLDNPGWLVVIDLFETDLVDKPFAVVERNMDSDTKWVSCRVKDFRFEGTGGPAELETILSIFLEWANGQ